MIIKIKVAKAVRNNIEIWMIATTSFKKKFDLGFAI